MENLVKPFAELLELVELYGEEFVASRLYCSPEFVHSWNTREHWKTKRVEPGWEPSAGFVASALTILRP